LASVNRSPWKRPGNTYRPSRRLSNINRVMNLPPEKPDEVLLLLRVTAKIVWSSPYQNLPLTRSKTNEPLFGAKTKKKHSIVMLK
jgi:hypothetical protein